MNTMRLIPAMLILATLGGCSGESGTKPTTKTTAPDPRPEVYEPAYRVATELRTSQEVGMNRPRFNDLLQKFATEVSLAGDKAETPREKEIVRGYTEALQIYKDAAAIWDLKVRIPELIDLADQKASLDRSAGSVDSTGEALVFSRAVTAGIPMNLFTKESTGIDALVARYQLPITDSEGWKIIPLDSVERIWAQARAKGEAVDKLQKP